MAMKTSEMETLLKKAKGSLISNGDPESQYKLGLLYAKGDKGFALDKKKALHWFEKAAKKDHADAQYALGEMLGDHKGFKWFEKAANQNHRGGLLKLIECYSQGIGIKNETNKKMALEFIKKAEALGDAEIFYWLGQIYENQRLLEAHTGIMSKQALYYMKAILLKGHTEAKNRLGNIMGWGYVNYLSGFQKEWQGGIALPLSLSGHSSNVYGVALSGATGNFGLSGSGDRTVRVWDLKSGSCLQVLLGHTFSVSTVAISEGGELGLSGAKDGTVCVWGLESGECLNVLSGHKNVVTSVALSENGTVALSGSCDNTLRIWNLSNGGRCLQVKDVNGSQYQQELLGHTSHVLSVALSADGKVGLSGSRDKTLRVWNLKSVTCLNVLSRHIGAVTSVALSADGTIGISGSEDRTLCVWDIKNGECLKVLSGHTDTVTCVALSADGRLGLSGGLDKKLLVWNLKTGESVWIFNCQAAINSISTFIDGNQLYALVGFSNGVVNFLPVGSFPETLEVAKKNLINRSLSRVGLLSDPLLPTNSLLEIKQQKEDVQTTSSRVSPLLSNTQSKQNRITSKQSELDNLGEKKQIKEILSLEPTKSIILPGHITSVKSTAINANGCFGLSGSDDNSLRFWDLKSGQCLKLISCQSSNIAISTDGMVGLSENKDKTLSVWDLMKGECLGVLSGHTSSITSVALSADGSIGLSGSQDKTLHVWDLKSMKCLQVLSGHKGTVWSVALSADGRLALSGSKDMTVRFWDLKSGECLKVLAGHTYGISSVALSADGTLGLSGSYDDTLRLWDLKSGECLKILSGHTNTVSCVGISADGTIGISGGLDNSLRIWNLKSGMCEEVLHYQTVIKSISIGTYGKQLYALVGLDDGTLDFRTFHLLFETKYEFKPNLLTQVASVSSIPPLEFEVRKSKEEAQTISIASNSISSPISISSEIKKTKEETILVPITSPLLKEELQTTPMTPSSLSSLQPLSPKTPKSIQPEVQSQPQLVEVQVPLLPQVSNAEIKITQEQLQFLNALKTSGVQPDLLSQLQKQWEASPLSKEELLEYKIWMENFSTKIHQLETDLDKTNASLVKDPQALSEQTYIDSHPKLKNYQYRLQKELIAFITCYFLAPVGLFKLEDNKNDTAISAIGSIPIAGQFLKVLTLSLSFANKKHKFYQISRLHELFDNLHHIAQVCCAFARRLTLAQEDTIQKYNLQKYQGISKIKGFVNKVKEFLDHPGVTYAAEDKLAVLDVSYLLEQILSGETKIDRQQDLAVQLVEVITGVPYQPRILPAPTMLSANLTLATQSVSITPTSMTVQSAMASLKITPALSSEDVQKMIDESLKKKHEEFERETKAQQEKFEAYKKEQEEAFRKQAEELEAAKQTIKKQQNRVDQSVSTEEMLKLQERVAMTEQDTDKLKKTILPKSQSEGGSMVQDQLSPISSADAVAHQTEITNTLSILSEQVRDLREGHTVLTENYQNASKSIETMQDKIGINRKKEVQKRSDLIQFEGMLAEANRQKETKAKEQKKLKEKQQLHSGFR